MYSSQIHRALASDPFASEYFAGVFPSDLLPEKITSFPCSAVANTDPASMPGKHWVAFHFDADGNGEYFDSYGEPPRNTPLFNFLIDNNVECAKPDTNPFRLQGLHSDVCGHYCIAFLSRRARGQTMKGIVESYRGKKGKPGESDEKVRKLVNKQFKIKELKRKHPPFAAAAAQVGAAGSSGEIEQCCCSLIQCCKDQLVQCHSVTKSGRKWLFKK
jgi:hypothetical protein